MLLQFARPVQASLCNAVVRLKLELYRLPASQPSALLLDGYNALFWRTDMFESESWQGSVRRLDAQELTLGANLRALADADVGHTAVLASVRLSGDLPDIPQELMRKHDQPFWRQTLPLLDLHELGSMLLYYRCNFSPLQLAVLSWLHLLQLLPDVPERVAARLQHYLGAELTAWDVRPGRRFAQLLLCRERRGPAECNACKERKATPARGPSKNAPERTCAVPRRFVHALAPTQAVTKTGVSAAHQLTQGDGKAVRKNLHFLLPYDAALDDMDAVGEAYAEVNLATLTR